mmetsp:Transcript_23521/g.55743  ORF Transcript_23521/g.55743 Transcript_23521/m.55743 type:complete len:287 (-) Transcript_23521:91-951(-)
MGKDLEQITDKERDFIRKQKVFFVATAPLSGEGHVNISPKSPGTSVFVVNSNTLCYIDLTGSGSETAAHVLENKRMTLMFCNIEEGLPMILRLYGEASFISKASVPQKWLGEFPSHMVSSPGFRGVFKLDVHRISSSCGYSLPVMTFQSNRNILNEYTDKKGIEGMKEYRLKKNSFSIDGLPSLSHLDETLLDVDKDGKGNIDDSVIIEDPDEGYIYGKIVSKQSEEFRKAEERRRNNGIPSAATIIRTRRQESLLLLKNMDPYVVFGLGLLVGSVVSWIFFLYAT